jgi:hypothetical protein
MRDASFIAERARARAFIRVSVSSQKLVRARLVVVTAYVFR